MASLNCTARYCTYNEGGVCSAGYILVEGISSSTSSDTYCSNYQEKSTGGVASSINNNYINSLTNGFTSTYDVRMNPEISCNATRCLYNYSGKCEAREINVFGDNNGVLGTRCETFTY